MKMEHVIQAASGGVVQRLSVAPGDTVLEGEPLVYIEEQDTGEAESADDAQADLDRVRPDLTESLQRHAITLEPKVLIVSKAFDDTTYLSARNVQPTLLMTSSEVNTEQLLGFKKIVLTSDALAQLAERTSK